MQFILGLSEGRKGETNKLCDVVPCVIVIVPSLERERWREGEREQIAIIIVLHT